MTGLCEASEDDDHHQRDDGDDGGSPKANSRWRLRCVEWQINTDILIRNCTQLNSNKTATSVSHLIAWRLPSHITVRISMSALLSVCKIANYLITRCVRASIEFSFANKQKKHNTPTQHKSFGVERAGGRWRRLLAHVHNITATSRPCSKQMRLFVLFC